MCPSGAPGDVSPVNAAQRSRKNVLHVVKRRAASENFPVRDCRNLGTPCFPAKYGALILLGGGDDFMVAEMQRDSDPIN